MENKANRQYIIKSYIYTSRNSIKGACGVMSERSCALDVAQGWSSEDTRTEMRIEE